MAKHFSEVKRELEQPDGHMAGIGQQLKLSEEARDARNAGRRLEDENDETDQAAYDEQVQVRDAWDETVTTGYKCSSCGATK